MQSTRGHRAPHRWVQRLSLAHLPLFLAAIALATSCTIKSGLKGKTERKARISTRTVRLIIARAGELGEASDRERSVGLGRLRAEMLSGRYSGYRLGSFPLNLSRVHCDAKRLHSLA